MILVTGGAGYVGSVLVPELLAIGESVRVVDTLWFSERLPAHPQLEIVQGDIRALDPAWLDDVTAVIHLAGLSNDPTAEFAPGLNTAINVGATRALAEAVAGVATQRGRAIRFLLASSCSVYYASAADPFDAAQKSEDSPAAPVAGYSRSKRFAELDVLRLGALCPLFVPVVLRKGTLYGLAPRMRFDLVLNAFTAQAWGSGLITVHGGGEAWRPLLHVRDAADAYLYCVSIPADRVRGQIFNVVRKNYRILELAHWIAEVLEQQRRVSIRVVRDRAVASGARSYYVLGHKMADRLGFQPDRGTERAALEIWDALVAGQFGARPLEDPRYINLRAFEQQRLGAA